MSDLISREKLLDIIKPMVGMWYEGTFWIDYERVIDIIEGEDLISAEPEQKIGKWVYDGIRGRFPACKCSICGHYENADWALLQGANYCPNCGAEMRGEEDEHTD